jgi:uncharacterized coiled-coil DUF342 family protein
MKTKEKGPSGVTIAEIKQEIVALKSLISQGSKAIHALVDKWTVMQLRIDMLNAKVKEAKEAKKATRRPS